MVSLSPPKIPGPGAGPVVRARVHDHKSPSFATDWKSVAVEWTAGGRTQSSPMRWYGEYLWRADLPAAFPPGAPFQVCATDAAGNRACKGMDPLKSAPATR
jgi:hypothetical protein